jgi:hypothetical protein
MHSRNGTGADTVSGSLMMSTVTRCISLIEKRDLRCRSFTRHAVRSAGCSSTLRAKALTSSKPAHTRCCVSLMVDHWHGSSVVCCRVGRLSFACSAPIRLKPEPKSCELRESLSMSSHEGGWRIIMSCGRLGKHQRPNLGPGTDHNHAAATASASMRSQVYHASQNGFQAASRVLEARVPT